MADTNAVDVVPSVAVHRTETDSVPVSASIEHPSPVHATGSTFEAIDMADVMLTVASAVTVQPPDVQVTGAPA